MYILLPQMLNLFKLNVFKEWQFLTVLRAFLFMEEVWKYIPGWEPMQVSNLGRVKGLRGGILKTQVSSDKNGNYEWLYLFKEGQRKYSSVHRLVAQTFLPNPENLLVVMHLDDNTLNNKLSNLKWGSHKDNTRDSIQKGRFKVVTNVKRGPRGKYKKKLEV